MEGERSDEKVRYRKRRETHCNIYVRSTIFNYITPLKLLEGTLLYYLLQIHM